jgi:hypothetical protein
MRGALFVADQNVPDAIFLAENFIVNRQDGAAGVAEYDFHTLILQRPQDNFRPGHLFAVHITRPVRLIKTYNAVPGKATNLYFKEILRFVRNDSREFL